MAKKEKRKRAKPSSPHTRSPVRLDLQKQPTGGLYDENHVIREETRLQWFEIIEYNFIWQDDKKQEEGKNPLPYIQTNL